MTTHGLQRYVDDLLRGRRPDAILSHSTFLTDRTGPRPSAAHRTETVARLEVRAVTAPSKSRPSPADLTSPSSAATRVTHTALAKIATSVRVLAHYCVSVARSPSR